jgi:hypothetical protein
MENKPKGKNRETILLIAVAVFGLGGLAILQFGRKGPAARTEDRAVLQAQNENTAEAQAAAKYQTVTGTLMRTNIFWIEVGQPFVFEMTQPVQGAIYELDMGDGSPRKVFENSKVRHVYEKKIKRCVVTLFAKYNGEEVALDTLIRAVQKRPKKEKIADGIDF